MAGTVTFSGNWIMNKKAYDISRPVSTIYVLVIDWTADSVDATVPSTATGTAYTDQIKGAKVLMALTDPGATAPTDLYDITITDAYGVDVFGGELGNRSTSSSEQALPKIGSGYGPRPVEGALTFNLTNNSVNSATGQVRVFFERKVV